VVEEKARGKRIQLRAEQPEALGEVAVDVRRFRQILYNLLSNAVKFTLDGGEVILKAQRVNRQRASGITPGFKAGRRTPLPAGEVDSFLEVSVSDTGIGMRPQDLAQLFTPFTQIEHASTRGMEGTGLGLAMVLRLAELHGGAVAVSSEPGRGTCFTVWLAWRDPQALTAPQAPATLGAPRAQAGPPPAKAPSKGVALIIEDEDRAATLMSLQLEAQGFVTTRVNSGEAALALSGELMPDLITLDVLLPGMDGWAFLRQMKALPRWANVPGVVVSVQPDGALGHSLGAALTLQKPVHHEDLKQGLQQLGLSPLEGRSVSALVVDDDAQAVELLAQPLRQLGCKVLRAYGGAEGVTLARRYKPDLILLDLQMPEFSGFQVVDDLKADPDSADIPILIVTGRDLSEDDRRQLNGQVSQIIGKTDLETGRFMGEVRRALSHRAPGAAVAQPAGAR
jgi:CheY-like chemotaxis protein